MEHIARLIQAALAELELAPEDVTEVEIERVPFTVWSVFLNGTYVYFDCDTQRTGLYDDSALYEPYTTVTPYTDEELASYGITEAVCQG